MSANRLLFDVTNRIGCGAIIIDSHGQIESYNETAERLAVSIVGKDNSSQSDLRSAIKGILNNNGSNRFRLNSESWVVVPRDEGRPLALHALPAGDESDPYKKTLIMLIDLDEHRSPTIEALQKLFNLTQSEAAIAVQISYGKTPGEIAQDRKITLWTVRSQLAAIFSKTQTRRQSDLVALMLKIALLS